MVQEPNEIIECVRDILVFQPFDVTHHLRLGMIGIENWMLQDSRATHFDSRLERKNLSFNHPRGRFASNLSEHRNDRIQIIRIGSLIDGNGDGFIRVAEIDLCGFGQFFDFARVSAVNF